MDERKSYVQRQREGDIGFMKGLRCEREREEALAGQRGQIGGLRAASEALELLETLGERTKPPLRQCP